MIRRRSTSRTLPATDVSTTDDNHTGAQNALAGAHTVTEPSVDGYTTLGWKVVNGLGDTNNCGSAPSEAVTSNNGGVGDAGLDNTAEVTVAGNSTRVICFYNRLDNRHITIVKLLADGSLDPTHFVGTISNGPDSFVRRCCEQQLTDNSNTYKSQPRRHTTLLRRPCPPATRSTATP